MVMELEILFPTTLLLNHVSGCLHAMTLGGPSAVCFCLSRRELISAVICIPHPREGQVPYTPGLYQEWRCSCLPWVPPTKGNS